jgi:hypothetical protein
MTAADELRASFTSAVSVAAPTLNRQMPTAKSELNRRLSLGADLWLRITSFAPISWAEQRWYTSRAGCCIEG